MLTPWLNVQRLAGPVLLAVLLANPVMAAPAATYGRDFVRLDRHWPDEAPLASAPQPPREGQGAAVAAQRERLLLLEQEEGPYAAALAEPLMDMGRYLQEAGEAEQAGQLYQRALHVLRINEGLYSDNQMPLLRSLFAIHRSLGDWQGLDARYDYYFRLAATLGELDVESAVDYFRWQREALRRQLDSTDHRRLLRLYEANEQLLAAADPALDAAGYWQLLDSQLRNLYLIQALVTPRMVSTTRGFTSAAPFRSEPLQEIDVHEQRLVNVQRSAVARGSELLSGFIDSAASRDEQLLAQALLALADWHQWNGDRRRAGEEYRQVVSYLQATGQDALLQKWFGSPVELPDNGAFSRDTGVGGVPVLARFAVTAGGRPRDVETTAADESQQGFAMRLYRKLLATRFRPRFENGAAVATAEVERNYRYLDPEAIRRFRSP
ncbi:hypothetical protein Q6D67_03215 [Haliea sp. E1-2-M8]|uniref:hypothetical protein n=1 Tax=Haliea sp. E1-2-M8 TaxID=3064706 RepID=UPI00271AA057|nr:hypothetical protein [Haliea sp. E1-2-M8]MDO8860700.1 hypothetical protein [Haliea sp. E1-2-M8]